VAQSPIISVALARRNIHISINGDNEDNARALSKIHDEIIDSIETPNKQQIFSVKFDTICAWKI